MITVNEALKLIEENFQPFGEERLSLNNAFGRLLAENLYADREYPPFHRVMMDGIAINSKDLYIQTSSYKITGTAPAGSPALKLKNSGECIEVMTGALLPKGADIVIPYEEVLIEDSMATIDLSLKYRTHQNIHLKGSDINKDAIILKADKYLTGPQIGIAASIGKSVLKVAAFPKINIISTGDELVAIDDKPQEYQIRRSNSQALKSSLNLFGYEDIELSHIKDSVKEIAKHFNDAKEKFDILIYSGGVSKGKFDFLPNFWEEQGVEKVFHRVSQKPGKPLWFGVDRKHNTTIFGLPGNPISSLVCLHRYFINSREIFVELGEDITFKYNLTCFYPVSISFTKDAKILATPISTQNSGEFSALSESDGFIELPKDKDYFQKGESFLYFPWRPL